jgi:apolipoprotein N-acyltransferase
MEVQTSVAALNEPPPGQAQALKEPPPGKRVSRWVLLCPVTSAVLLWAAYFPLAWGWCAWFALVPLLALARIDVSGRRFLQYAWLCGLVFYFPALQWMRVADPRMYATWFALAIYCSLYVPLAIGLIRRLDRRTRLPLVLTVPLIWTALEFIRAHFLGGFAWYFLGHSQHAFLPLIQVSDVGGAYAVTFVVALVNALLFELACSSAWVRRIFFFRMPRHAPARRMLALQAAAVALIVTGCIGYGRWRLIHAPFKDGPTVSLIQGNLDQRIRNQPDAAEEVLQHFAALNLRALQVRPLPDLIVWPETSFPYGWDEISPEVPDSSLQPKIRELKRAAEADARHTGASPRDRFLFALNRQMESLVSTVRNHILVGANTIIYRADNTFERYNSALLVDGGTKIVGRYDKIHRVPFGEYVPFRDWFPWMNALAPYDFDYSIRPGAHLTRLPLGDYHFGVIICYEDTDPDLARRYSLPEDGAPAADFLVNISNDGWFNGTSEHEEHLAICRFRAVEARRSVARAVNMGVSAVIDGDGRVVALSGPTWAESKKVSAVLTAAVPIDERASLYARWGDWLPWSCLGVVALGLVVSLWRRRSLRPA